MNPSDAGKRGYEASKDKLDEYRSKLTQNAIEKYEANPKFCLHCGEKIPFEKRANRFCNHTCAASHNNLGVTRHSKRSQFCECGNVKRRQNKYCPDCIEKGVYLPRVETFEELKSDSRRKAWLLKERGHRCESCGLEVWLNNVIPLELDHIDGNADNNNRSNLRLICPNCHALTATYKGANAGKGSKRQQMRRQRYKDGKTF